MLYPVRSGGVGHRIGAVGDDETIVGGIIFADGMHEQPPLVRPHVGGIQAEQLHSVDLAKVCQFRHKGEQLFRRDGGGQTARGGGFAGDGAASGQKEDFFHGFVYLSCVWRASPPCGDTLL